MEGQRRGASGTHARPPAANTSRSLLHSLQSENESLRSDLLRAQQKGASLQHQLDVLRSSTDQIVRDAVAVSAEQVRALEERCRLLAERLVAFKRDGQVSESAQVTFLLRSRLEERRFLKRGLTAMLESLSDTTAEAPVLAEAAADDEAHTGTLYRLVMAASNALLEHTAAAKLEKARTRLALEHAVVVLEEVHGAIQNATRAAYEAARHAESVEEALLSSVRIGGGNGEALPPLLTAVSSLRGGFLTPSPARRVNADHSLHTQDEAGNRAGASSSTIINTTTTTRTAPPAALPLAEELEWVCDVLKACLRGVRDVGGDIASAVAELQAPLASSTSAQRGAEDAVTRFSRRPPLAAAASPEMNALLRSFLDDLAVVKQRAAAQQEDMARQLAQEVQRHYASTQQYEERIQLLESECAGLLRYTERVAEENARRRPEVSSSADLAAPLPPQQQQQQQQQRNPPVRSQRDAAVGTDALPASTTSTPQDDKDDADRVTPERYTAKPQETVLTTPPARSVAEPLRQQQPHNAAADTSVTDPSMHQQAPSVHRPRVASNLARRTRHRDAAHGRRDTAAAAGPAAAADPVTTAPLRGTAGPSLSAVRLEKPLLLSPRREPASQPLPPPPSRPTSPSAAARALWFYYQSRNASLLADASAAVDSPRSRLSQRIMSPVPPPPPPPPPPSAHAASRPAVRAAAAGEGVAAFLGGSTSPWRRSVTASVPAGRRAPSPATAAAVSPTSTLATSLSSVSSTSDLLSTPGRVTHAPDGLVSSHIGSRTAGLWSSLIPDAAASSAARTRVGAVVAVPPAGRTALADPPLSPPRGTSTASSPSDHSSHRTRLSQQLYDEAAADVFSDDVDSVADGFATPTAQRRRTAPSRSSSVSGARDGAGAAAQADSPRRPLHMGLRVPRVASTLSSASWQAALHPTHDPPSPTPLPPPPDRDAPLFAATSRLEEVPVANTETAEATPVAWRRMKEEVTAQQQRQQQRSQHPSQLWQSLASPMAGASDLFGTPREASWIDS